MQTHQGVKVLPLGVSGCQLQATLEMGGNGLSGHVGLLVHITSVLFRGAG